MLTYQNPSQEFCFVLSFPPLLTFFIPLHLNIAPLLPLSISLFALLFFVMLKKVTKSIVQDCCKFAPISSLLSPCHSGVSKDKFLQPSNKTK